MRFVEAVCTHQKAEWAGQPFLLSPKHCRLRFRKCTCAGSRGSRGLSRCYLRGEGSHFLLAVAVSPDRRQQPAILPRTGPQSDLALSTQAPVLQRDAANCQKVPKGQAPRVGLEQSADSPRRVQVSETGAAKSAAVGDKYTPDDPDLAQVINAWHALPPDTRTAILAIVEAAQGR